MPRERTRLSDKDFKLLKKEGMMILGNIGPLFPMFGNNLNDFIKFHVYDMNDTYLKSGVSEDFENDGHNINLKPGNDLRKVGFVRGNYKVKYFFYRRLAGADEVVLTKSVGDESGVVHSGDPKLTGEPMGAFYVDEDGKVFEGEKSPVDGSEPSELDVKEYKFFIDEISADRKEVRLATQAINLYNYKDEFNRLYSTTRHYVPKTMAGSPDEFNFGEDLVLYGSGKFNNTNAMKFQFDVKEVSDPGFHTKYVGGTLEIKNAYVVGYESDPATVENPDWSLEDPIPPITIETNYDEYQNATTSTPVIFSAIRESGNSAPGNLSYYWNFGCGHKEFGGPEISHRYTKTGNMNVSVVINSPNFTDTVVVEIPISITQGILGPLGYSINTFTVDGTTVTFTMANDVPETSLEYIITSNNGPTPLSGTISIIARANTESVSRNIEGLNSGTLTLKVRLLDSIDREGDWVEKTVEYTAPFQLPIANFSLSISKTIEEAEVEQIENIESSETGTTAGGTGTTPPYDPTATGPPGWPSVGAYDGWVAAGSNPDNAVAYGWQDPDPTDPTTTPTGGCFIAGTQIQMNEIVKSIEDIKVGDIVKSFDVGTSSIVDSKVTKTYVHSDRYYMILNGTIKTTSVHPFYTDGKWREAGSLSIGDKILHVDGIEHTIETIELSNEPVTVYNIEVENTHNYFAEGYLVHNK